MYQTFEGEFTSTSATAEELLTKAAAPVELHPELKKKYQEAMFTYNIKPNENGFSLDGMKDAATQTLSVAAQANNLFAFCRKILMSANMFDDMPENQVKAELQNLATSITSINNDYRDEKKLRDFLIVVSTQSDTSGKDTRFPKGTDVADIPTGNVIIRPSQRYKGGKDLIFSGLFGRGGMKSAPLPFPDVPVNKNNSRFETLRSGAWQTPIAEKALEAAKFVMESLTSRGDHGKLEPSNFNRRHICQFPVDYNFKSWNREISRIFGFDLEFFTNLGSKAQQYKDFLNAVVILDTDDFEMSRTWAFYVANKAKHEKQLASGMATQEPTKPVNEEIWGEQFAYTQAVRGTISISFQREIVNYLCQSEEGSSALYCLHTWINQWSSAFLKPKFAKGGKAPRSVPQYIVPPSRVQQMAADRKKFGYHVSESKADSDGMTVLPNGTLGYIPAPEDSSGENAIAYEKAYEEMLEFSYSLGTPADSEISALVSGGNPEHLNLSGIDGEYRNKKDQLAAMQGSLIAFNWDYNNLLYVDSQNGFVSVDLNGCIKPDALVIADFLGYDFKEAGEKDQKKHILNALLDFGYNPDDSESLSAANIFEHMRQIVPNVGIPRDRSEVNSRTSSVPFAVKLFLTQRMFKLFETYSYYAQAKVVPDVAKLIEETKQEMGYTAFTQKDTPLDFNIYNRLLPDTIDGSSLIEAEHRKSIQGHLVLALLLLAMKDAECGLSSNLYSVIAEELGAQNVDAEKLDHPAFFNFLNPKCRMADFGNVYNYFGGRVFKNMCKYITKIPKKELLYPTRVAKGKQVPSFNYISKDVLPMATVFSKYVPNYLDYFDKAEEIFESYQKDDDLEAEDIIAPGVVAIDGKVPQVFPHQVTAHKFLRKAPKFAVLDISPGGGKTLIGQTDIWCLAEKHKNDNFVPVVLCPDGLCANWCEDAAKFSGGNWNTIPITTKIVKVWGLELLTKIIKEAPRNTVIIMGLSFLSKTNMFDISFGSQKVKVSGGVEFLKQFSPTYVLLDESHKAKKFKRNGKTSNIHNVVKEVFTMTSIMYSRLATGTLVHGVIEDVIGQAALLNPYALKTPDEQDRLGIDLQATEGPGQIRTKLAKYTSLISLKRKEWAFMLPNPIDSFIQIRLYDVSDPKINKQGNLIHQEAYEHVMNEIKDILLSGELKPLDDDEDESSEGEGSSILDGEEDDDGSEDGEEGSRGKKKPVVDSNGVLDASMLPMIDKQYLQRAEQLITNPWGDSYFREVAKLANLSEGDFIPAKINEVISRLRSHFETVKFDPDGDQKGRVILWERDMQPKEYDVVEYKSRTYMRRPIPLAEGELPTIKRRLTPKSSLPPDQDLENWKPELKGKVLVFCRYTGNTKAIFNALPPEFKRKARMFHGQIPEDQRKQNLEDFRNNPDVEILVANEQAITEGYNLQMASRIIRVDTPWSPGDYEQSTARIFRPDPAAAKIEDGKPGDMAREVIYIDWIMTGGTMEVGKVARLMWKSVANVRFNEKGNPRYTPLNEYVLEPITMGLEFLFKRCEIDDYLGEHGVDDLGNPIVKNDYFGAKTLLANIESVEFTEMRKTTRAEMINLPVPPIPKDFRIMPQIPTMPNQTIPDPENFGLVKLTEYIKANLELAIEDADELLKGSPVKTGFGTGTIVGVQRTNKIPDPENPGKMIVNKDRPIHSVRIKYHARNMLENIPAVNMPIHMVYIAMNVNGKRYDEFFKPTEMWGTETERKQMERAAAKQAAETERARQIADAENARRMAEERAAAAAQKRAEQRKVIRDQNRVEGKPLETGVEKIPKIPKIRPVLQTVPAGQISGVRPVAPRPVKPKKIKLIPTFYNGFLCAHVTNNDSDAESLSKLGFKNFPAFAYIDFKSYPLYEGFLMWLDDKITKGQLTVDRPTVKRMEAVFDLFDATKVSPKQLFNIRHSKKLQSQVQDFFRARLRESTDKKSLKMYPVVMFDRLRVVADLTTSPIAKRLLNKLVPQAKATWAEHPGMHIFFAAGKREFMAKLRDIKAAGYEITNQEKLVQEIDKLRM